MTVETAFRDRESACSPEIADWRGASLSRLPRGAKLRVFIAENCAMALPEFNLAAIARVSRTDD